MGVWLLRLDALGLNGPVSEVFSTALLPHYGYDDDQRYSYVFNEQGNLVSVSDVSGDPFPFMTRTYAYSNDGTTIVSISEMDFLGSGWQGTGFELLVKDFVQTGSQRCASFTLFHLNERAEGYACFDLQGRIKRVEHSRDRHQSVSVFTYNDQSMRPNAVTWGSQALAVWDESIQISLGEECYFYYDELGRLIEVMSYYHSPHGTSIIYETYQYHESDSFGNWVSRTRTEHYGERSTSHLEIRLITYFE
jgi:hypothetical protein